MENLYRYIVDKYDTINTKINYLVNSNTPTTDTNEDNTAEVIRYNY